MNILGIMFQMGEIKIPVTELFPGVNLIDKTGIPFIYETRLDTNSIAALACNKLPANLLSDVKLFILATQTSDDSLSSNAISIANTIGLKKKLFALIL
jgi:hypothetical protein